jgi:hypothetical protein
MFKRKFVILSCLLAMGAINCQLMWLSHCGRSLVTRAHSVTLAEDERAAAIAEADDILTAGRLYPYFGIGAAVAALLLAIISQRWGEPASPSLTWVLLVIYVLTLFILV